MAPSITSAVMEAINNTTPVKYAMMAEFLRFHGWSAEKVIALLRPTIAHDIFHSVRAIWFWTKARDWGNDKKLSTMSFFMVRMWQRVRDSHDMLDIYQVLVFWFALLSTESFSLEQVDTSAGAGTGVLIEELQVETSLLPARIAVRTQILESWRVSRSALHSTRE
jgi:hypothetical protein